MVDADGFQVVKKRKGYKNKFCQDNHRPSTKTWSKLSSSEIVHFDVNELKSKIVKCRYEKVSFSHCNLNLWFPFLMIFFVMDLYTGMKF